MACHQSGKFWRLQDRDPVAPLVKVPCHFEVPRRPEPDGQATVGIVGHHLCRMERELAGDRGGIWGKAPNHFAIFVVIMIAAKGARGVGRQVKSGVTLKAVGQKLRRHDAVQSEMLHPAIAAHLARHQIAACTKQQAMRLKTALAPVARGVTDG